MNTKKAGILGILFLTLYYFSQIAIIVGGIWLFSSYIAYLVKDYSTTAIWLTVGSLVLLGLLKLIALLVGIVVTAKKKKEEEISQQKGKKSKFQERLEQAMAERNKSNLN